MDDEGSAGDRSAEEDLVTEDEIHAFRAFHAVLERARGRIEHDVREVALKMPAFAALVEQQDPKAMEAQAEEGRRLEREALIDQRWAGYLANLAAQGRTYAELGVAFGDWYQLLKPYRAVVYDEVLAAGESRAALDGMDRFLDIAMSALASAYLDAKAKLIREAEARLERHVRELERSNRDLDDFVYIASHDLRAPLRDIDNLVSWIVEDAAAVLPAGSQRHLGLLKDRVRRMERLLEDLLHYSRTGRVAVPFEDIGVEALIQEVLGLVAPPAGFEVVVTGDRPTIRAPRVPIALAVRNLVTNAVKHHDKEHGHVEIHVEDAPEQVEIAVIDDGPGIPPEFRDRVFRVFHTLRPRDEVEGSGIGLSIVKKVADTYGATVRIESPPTRGTIVRLAWPKSAGAHR